MKIIYLLTDYKSIFGSKYTAKPYRSGFSKEKLIKYFNEHNLDPVYINPSGFSLDPINLSNKLLLYTSQEDHKLHYKTFLQDFVYAAELAGAIVIPPYKYLHAHENKVFQEISRVLSGDFPGQLKSWWFGTFEEFMTVSQELQFPLVIKHFSGAGSKKVFLAENIKQATRIIRRISRSEYIPLHIKDKLRRFLHPGYTYESRNRQRFILQEYVKELKNDWKVLIYDRKYFILKRGIKKGDFRASGQGKLSFDKDIPEGLLDYAKQVYENLDVPNISLDIIFDGSSFYLIEYQVVYFGTYTFEFNDHYYLDDPEGWKLAEEKLVVEEEYVNSIMAYINSKGLI